MGGALLQNTLHLGATPHTHLILFFIVLVLVFGASKSYKESLSPWKKEQLLV
jgi:hypothetical protein